MGKDRILLGGQAVIEGVMIKSPNYISVAVRNEKGKIVSMKERLKKPKLKLYGWPFIRGTYNLIQMLIIGMKALVWSANKYSDEEEELSKTSLILTLGLSIFFAISIFIALPYILTNWTGIKEEIDPIFFNFVDSLIKITLFVIHIVSISFMKDVKRLFQYHGAEHKAVYCYESGKELTVKNTDKFPTMHPRCGTSFIMLVFMLSIIFFSLLPSMVIFIYPTFLDKGFIFQKLILFGLRILAIPIIAGSAYELLRFGAKRTESILIKILVRPGIWLQLLTTKQPDKKQIEVAIYSLKQSLRLEKT